MDTKILIHKSKFISLVLRHHPERFGLKLDSGGWVAVDDLIVAARRANVRLDLAELHEIVRTNDKQRFALSEDGKRIRANQGHSVEVDLGLQPQVPPELLYHGTAERFLNAIMSEGLKPQSRQHVHLSADYATAEEVGRRHGKPKVLVVRAGELHRHGHKFFLSENDVWLTSHVPPLALEYAPEPKK